MKDLEPKVEESKKDESKKGFMLSRLDFFKSFTSKDKGVKLLSTWTIFGICALLVLGFVLWGKFKEVRLNNQIAVIKEKISKVDSLYRIDSTEYHDLKSSPSLIEHIAREDYYMKEEGEEIYIIQKAESNEQAD